jgi:hypothetical protein
LDQAKILLALDCRVPKITFSNCVTLKAYCRTAWTAGTADPVNHLKQPKLQKDAHANRSHNRRCSDHL